MGPKELTYSQSLIEAGLTKDEALVYETLVLRGPLQAGVLARHTPLSRPLVYKVLSGLEAVGLVEKRDEPGKVALFAPAHPLKLKELLDKRFESAQNAKVALDGAIGHMISDFNLRSGKPGVRFYEGKEGAKAILFESLSAKEEIYTYADSETIDRYVAKENEEYVRARIKRGIRKKILMPDTPGSRKECLQNDSTLTDIRLLPASNAPLFSTAIQVYDNVVSYLTFTDQFIGGTQIHDPAIYRVHRYLFENAWQSALRAEDIKPHTTDVQ